MNVWFWPTLVMSPACSRAHMHTLAHPPCFQFCAQTTLLPELAWCQNARHTAASASLSLHLLCAQSSDIHHVPTHLLSYGA